MPDATLAHVVSAMAIYKTAGAVRALHYMRDNLKISLQEGVDLLEVYDVAEDMAIRTVRQNGVA